MQGMSLFFWQYLPIHISLFFPLWSSTLLSILLFLTEFLFVWRDCFPDPEWCEKKLMSRMYLFLYLSRKGWAGFPPGNPFPHQRSFLFLPLFPIFLYFYIACCSTGKTTGSSGLPLQGIQLKGCAYRIDNSSRKRKKHTHSPESMTPLLTWRTPQVGPPSPLEA